MFIIARTSAYVTIIIDKQTHILSILSLTERNKQTQNSTNNETNSSKSQTSKQAETMTSNDDENALKMSLYLDAKAKTMREARHSLLRQIETNNDEVVILTKERRGRRGLVYYLVGGLLIFGGVIGGNLIWQKTNAVERKLLLTDAEISESVEDVDTDEDGIIGLLRDVGSRISHYGIAWWITEQRRLLVIILIELNLV